MGLILIFISCLVTLCIVFYFYEVKSLAAYLMFITMLILMGLAYGIADSDNYVSMFNMADSFTYDTDPLSEDMELYGQDYGYAVINKIFFSLGFDFTAYKFLISLIGLLMIKMIGNKMTKSMGLVFLLYLIHPFFLDVIQIRNFCAECIILYSLYIVSIGGKYSDVKYIIAILIAALFHKIALIYLLFLIVKKYYHNMWLKCALIIALCMPVYARWIITYAGDLYTVLASVDMLNRYSQYALINVEYGFIVHWVYMLIITYISGAMYGEIAKSGINKTATNFTRYTYFMCIALCLILPFMPFTSELMRAPRNIMISIYIVAAIYFDTITGIDKKIIFAGKIISISIFIGLMYFYVPLGENADDILNHNYLFDILE